MATVENFLLKFKVDGQAALNGASNSIKNIGTQVSGLTGGLGGLAGGVAVVGSAFAAMGMKAIALADEISDISDATGISAGALLNFKQSLVEAGGKADDFSTLAAKLNQNIGDAAEGSDKAQKAFRNLGVFVTDAGGNIRSTEVILQDAIARLAAIEDPSRRAAAAVDLFGKSAAKLDFTKLNAIRDPVADADIKRLADYQAAIDKVRNRLETGLISFFGSLAEDIDNAQQKMDKLIGAAGKKGNKIVLGPMGLPVEVPMTDKEKEAARIRELERLMAPAAGKPRGRTQEAIDKAKEGAPKGGFGAESDAMRKRRMEIMATSEAYKIQNNQLIDNINFEKAMVGKTDEYVQVEKAREEVIKRAAAESAKLQDAKKALGKDEGALAAVYDAQIAKITKASQVDADRVASATQGLIDLRTVENARKQDIENTTKAIEAQINRQQQLGDILRGINDQQVDINFEKSLKGLTPIQQEIAKIQENGRKAALEAGRSFAAAFDSEDGLTPERAQELADGLAQIAQGYRDISQAQIEAVTNVSPLMDSWEEYKNKALDTSSQIKSSFENFTNGMEDALVKFVQTGKLSFNDLANSIIADLARIAVKKAIVAIGTSLFGFAAGGPVMAGTPIIVGERGPEMFVPKTAGKIVPNNQLGGGGTGSSGGMQTVVNYNIQAVDAQSFRSLVARDPSFIYAVTEQGRRSQPTRSR